MAALKSIVLPAALSLVSASRAAWACGDLLIVYDRSGSMAECQIDGATKEAIARKAVKTVISKFSATPMGLYVFPDTLESCGGIFGVGGDPCRIGKLVVPLAADGASKVGAWLDTMPRSCGGTPTGDTMQVVKDHTGWTPGLEHFVLLLTDGQPTCQDGDDGAMPPAACDGKGSIECKNPTKVFDAVKTLFDKGVHTFVVGFEGMGVGRCGAGGGGGLPFNPDTLNKMADLGGEPAAGATRYYSATNEMTLAAALEKILGRVAGGTVGGCVPAGKDGSAGPEAGGGPGGGGADAGGGPGGGQDGGSQDPGGGPHPGRGTPGCTCRAASGAPAPWMPLLAPGLLILLRERRRLPR